MIRCVRLPVSTRVICFTVLLFFVLRVDPVCFWWVELINSTGSTWPVSLKHLIENFFKLESMQTLWHNLCVLPAFIPVRLRLSCHREVHVRFQQGFRKVCSYSKATVQSGIIPLPAFVLALHPPSTRLFVRLASATLIYNSNHLTASAYHWNHHLTAGWMSVSVVSFTTSLHKIN